MKVTYSWLKEYCKFDLGVDTLAKRLTFAGLEVEAVEPLENDWLLDVRVTANRSDLLSVIGIAREVAAITGASLVLPPVGVRESGLLVEKVVGVRVDDPVLCPRYTARVIRDVRVGPSPAWLAKRLESVGLRPINNVVDVTNFVLMECGQPLHAFDFDLLRGSQIIVRRARSGERITAIDGTKHDLVPEMLVIADASRPVAIAGVMGGMDTEVSAATQNVLLESALFNQVSIRRTSRRLGLMSESSYRFERGVDPGGVEWASRRAARLIQEVAGGEIASGVIDVCHLDLSPKTVTLRFSRLNGLLGLTIDPDEAVEILQRLGFEPRHRDSASVTVSVPTFRQADVYREADLIEEVGRMHGYDRLPEATTMKMTLSPRSRTEVVRRIVRDLLVGAGYSEVVTISFSTDKAAQLVSPWSQSAPLRVQNPVARGLEFMRRSLMPGLLEVKQRNQRVGAPQVFLFEIANVYLPVAGQEVPDHKLCLAIVEDESFDRLKGAVELLLSRLGLNGKCAFYAEGLPFFAAEERALLKLGQKVLGVLGRVSPQVAADYDLRRAPYMAELDFDLLVAEAMLERRFERLPAFPPIVRDLAIVVDEAVTWDAVCGCVRQVGAELLTHIEFFDIYRGKQIPAGKKSLAFSLTFQSPERTLTSEEVDKVQSAIVENLAKTLGAELRK